MLRSNHRQERKTVQGPPNKAAVALPNNPRVTISERRDISRFNFPRKPQNFEAIKLMRNEIESQKGEGKGERDERSKVWLGITCETLAGTGGGGGEWRQDKERTAASLARWTEPGQT